MIFVLRDVTTKPGGFDVRAKQWKLGLDAALKAPSALTASEYWASVRPQIRDDAGKLYAIFAGKCAFCEAKMAHVSWPHIEHYRPKSNPAFLQFVFMWENWLLSCGRCNDKKWAHFPICGSEPCLLDPTMDRPEEHLDFVDHEIVGKTERGKRTISLVGLDRDPLVQDRAFWLMQIDALLLLCLCEEAKMEARRLLVWAMQEDAPYAAMTRRYIRHRAPKLACPPSPHSRVTLNEPKVAIRELIDTYGSRLQEVV